MKKVLVINTRASKEEIVKSLTKLVIGKVASETIVLGTPNKYLDKIILEFKERFEKKGYIVTKRNFKTMSFEKLQETKPAGFMYYSTYITKVKEVK